jgi:hypothetical protein
MPIWISLTVIFSVLFISIIASLRADKSDDAKGITRSGH